ncbi:MAG: DUF2851 family protein [Terrimicrobiaceae bacterium]|nr:DUF2851 family protein [Terrimicrobiaceae bacterium]
MNADAYARARGFGRVQEPASIRRSEIEWQARLFAGELGTTWSTLDGRTVEVLHFGEWNHEAGPDFKGARVRFSDGNEATGDIELDPDIRDWEAHGHAQNPAYAGVILQLFIHSDGPVLYARTVDNRVVAQAKLETDGQPARPLRGLPGSVDDEAARRMIEEAAEFRLRTRHAARARAASLHGPDTALFHAIAAGLGYKNNTIAFLLTAQRAGLRASGAAEGEARLFGLAGFLESTIFDSVAGDTRDYLRGLWESWWRHRDRLVRLVLPPAAWNFSGLRPSNHPHRRMGALATVAADFAKLRQALRADGVAGFERVLGAVTHRFWSRHWNLSAATLDREMALIGSDRLNDLVINVAALTLPIDRARSEWAKRAGSTPGGKILRAAEWLAGTSGRKWTKSALHQQGLIQLYDDFGSLTALEAWARIRQG